MSTELKNYILKNRLGPGSESYLKSFLKIIFSLGGENVDLNCGDFCHLLGSIINFQRPSSIWLHWQLLTGHGKAREEHL
jgi:hypothetical protein